MSIFEIIVSNCCSYPKSTQYNRMASITLETFPVLRTVADAEIDAFVKKTIACCCDCLISLFLCRAFTSECSI